ncbi:hypothetical protein KR032_004909, partial [Drosophila birchii]
LWDKVEKEYEICSDLIAQEGSLSTLPLLQAKYDYCYSVYETCAAQISETLERVTPQAVQAPPSQPHISSGCRLPPCDTEVFDGDYLRWPTFRDLFTAVYVNNPRLTPVEKLFHLLTKTSGEAKAIVSKSPLTNDGFASAWEALQDPRALFDSGSEATFISERMFNLLKLPFQKIQTQVSGLNQSVSAESTRLCQFAIRSPTKPGLQLDTAAYVLPELAGKLPSHPVSKNSLQDLPDLQWADPNFFESSQIDILIGADILPSVMMQGTRRNICGSLLGQETIFGWVLTGPISHSKANRVASFTTQVHHKNEDSLDSLLSKFWEVEDLPFQMVKESDSYCERNFLQTTKRDASGRYVVTLPFCDPENSGSDLGYSRSIALAQFLRNENRLRRDFPLKEQYDCVIQEYLDLGHMNEVPSTLNSPTYYLPHHAVIKPESTTTKLRVVFNASSPSANGTSLNDILHAGPVLQSDLTIQILKWRYFRYEARETHLTRADPGSTSREARRAARSRSITRWQAMWDSSTKGRWTHRLIPDISSWVSRRHGEVDFYLTQVLSGHGCFRSHLKRFGHDEEDNCPACCAGVVEDAQHVLFECYRFHHEREELEAVVGKLLTAENFVPTMLGSEEGWDAIAKFVASVLQSLRSLEKTRRTSAE